PVEQLAVDFAQGHGRTSSQKSGHRWRQGRDGLLGSRGTASSIVPLLSTPASEPLTVILISSASLNISDDPQETAGTAGRTVLVRFHASQFPFPSFRLADRINHDAAAENLMLA